MDVDVSQVDVVRVYHMLTDLVVPRPIAWVSTVDAEGRVNLAPFSFFNAFGANPPIAVFSPTLRRDGSKKDTLLNVEATGEFAVNLAVEALAAKVNETSKEWPRGEDEAAHAGLAMVPCARIRPPRVKDSPAHLECRVRQIVSFGEAPIAPNLVIGEVIHLRVDDGVLDEGGRVDPKRLKPIARMGMNFYCTADGLFEMDRPT